MRTIFIVLLLVVSVGESKSQTDLENSLLQMYVSQHKAIEAGDLEGVKAHVTAESLKQIEEEEDQDFILEMIQYMTPPFESIEFGSCKVNGETAELSATSNHEGENSTGVIQFVKEGDDWKIAKVQWHSTQE